MLAFSLAPGISFCEPDGQRIFLDLAHDRYFALGATSNDAFTRLANGVIPSEGDHALLARLEAGGVLRATTGDLGPFACTAPVIGSAVLDRSDLPTPSRVLTLQAAILLHRAKGEISRIPLDRLCAGFATQKTSARSAGAPPAAAMLPAIASAFQAASRLVTTLDQCFAVSLALGRLALARRLPADIVFGVKVRPFQAHAWLQIGDVVVSDRFDNVRPYTPILVL